MIQIDLHEATIEWLNTFLTRYGGLASHVDRDEYQAHKWFLGHHLNLDAPEVSTKDAAVWNAIRVNTTDNLDADDLRKLLNVEISYLGKVFRFDSLSAEIDRYFPCGETPDRWIEITFKATP